MSGKRPAVSAQVKPNAHPTPGPLGNTQGIIVPDTESSPHGNSAPPIRATAEEAGWWGRWGSAVTHGVLDVVGLIPVVGEVADGANALIYLAEGDTANAALSAAAMIPGAGAAATGAKYAKRAGTAVEGAMKGGREAAEHAGKKDAADAATEQEAKRAQGSGGGKDKAKGKRKPKRRCELLPYNQLECEPGQEAHHVVPDWMLRMGKRGESERIPDMPSLADGPAICLERGSGNEHNTAHKHTDRPAQRVAKNGRGTGVPGTITLGQAKTISARAIEKATGGTKGGGCDRKDIQKQLDENFKAHNNTLLRGIKDARQVTDQIRTATRRTEGDI